MKILTDKTLGVIGSVEEIAAVGHRFAHGGERLKTSSVLGDEEIAYLESIVELNPLHGPPAISGFKACKAVMPRANHVGVFDTSYYSDLGEYAYIYPVPYELYEKYKIRRYGFHGTSHRYVAGKAAELLGRKDAKIITCHLGNGSSITAHENGRAVDTSMGFTPQDGVPMGTRSGALDPTVVTYIMKAEGLSAERRISCSTPNRGFWAFRAFPATAGTYAKRRRQGTRERLSPSIFSSTISKRSSDRTLPS